MAKDDKKEPDFVFPVSKNPEDAVYFYKDVDAALQPQSREMLLKYTGVPSDQLISHIKEAQSRAFKVAPYSSVGSMTWLNPFIVLHFAYSKALEKVKNGGSILDCACMIAQDLRQLAFDGAPTDKMYGFDFEPEFFNIGYDFFQDRATFRGSFLEVDATKDFSETELRDLSGKVDVIWCAKFIHLYDWDDQIEMASKLVRLLKPQPGSLFLGSQNGFPGGRSMSLKGSGMKVSKSNMGFLNDVDHLKEIWEEVGKRTGLDFDVEVTLLDLRTIGWHKDSGSDYHKTIGYNLQYLITMK
ncbi:hypothetical protein PRZ48_014928 [Zasmidium cellare]|uniref:Methyltransferase domain-containing protein n=1 Tax=Zasmidium cellare TaxID=395010 RepID=A0ABR0DX53_ZASCE|nr:hypothetical protein PRZ48_014928 [Zasmidium cellare]